MAKYKRCRSQQQRAFAAGIIHSMGIYEGLQAHAQEIRAMLVARNLIDESRAVPSSVGTGARPPAGVDTNGAAATWLQATTSRPLAPGQMHRTRGMSRTSCTSLTTPLVRVSIARALAAVPLAGTTVVPGVTGSLPECSRLHS